MDNGGASKKHKELTMKNLTMTFFLLLTAANAHGAITKSTLKNISFTRLENTQNSIEVCGNEANHRKRCETFKGVFLRNTNNVASTYKTFEISDDEVFINDMSFATTEDSNTLLLTEDFSCELKLFRYRYTMKERINAFAAGFLVKNRDGLNLYCKAI